MQLLNNITDAADQLMIFPLPDGTDVTLEFYYRPTIQRWSVDIQHPTLPGGSILGYNLCLGPNILRPWKNVIPFGMAVTSTIGLDPILVTDFLNNVAQVYMLSAAEVLQVESDILAPIPLVNP